jgi:hypothetical protein
MVGHHLMRGNGGAVQQLDFSVLEGGPGARCNGGGGRQGGGSCLGVGRKEMTPCGLGGPDAYWAGAEKNQRKMEWAAGRAGPE